MTSTSTGESCHTLQHREGARLLALPRHKPPAEIWAANAFCCTGDITLVDETKQEGRKTHFVVDVEPTTPSPLSQQPSTAAPAGASLAGAGAQSRPTGMQWLDTEGSVQSQSAETPGTPTHYPPGLEAVDASAAPLPPKKSKSLFYNPFQRRPSPKSRVTSFAFRTSAVKGLANKDFDRTSDKEDPARKTSWFGKLLGATADIRSVLSLSTEAEKAAEDHQAAIEAIEALDKNRDGRHARLLARDLTMQRFDDAERGWRQRFDDAEI